MMKKEAKSWDDFKNLAAEKQDRTVYQNRKAGDKLRADKMDQYSQPVDREVKLDD